MDLFEKTIISSENQNLIKYFVTPLAPYFICNHYISTEIERGSSGKYVEIDIEIKANNLLKNKNYDDIKNLEIIQIQVDYLNFFYEEVLPIITNKNIQVIIITSQWHLPQVHKSTITDELLNHKNIFLWISQNPIYTNSDKYMGFPYGILHLKLNEYINFIKNNNCNKNKIIKITNQFSSCRDNLPDNHIRKKYPIFGINSGYFKGYTEFLKNILDSEFVISTTGDRDDCYRHYECIGLNTLPISNINNIYKSIFDDNMIYSNEEEMVDIVNNNSVNYQYKKPNRDILTIEYWMLKINEKKNKNKE